MTILAGRVSEHEEPSFAFRLLQLPLSDKRGASANHRPLPRARLPGREQRSEPGQRSHKACGNAPGLWLSVQTSEGYWEFLKARGEVALPAAETKFREEAAWLLIKPSLTPGGQTPYVLSDLLLPPAQGHRVVEHVDLLREGVVKSYRDINASIARFFPVHSDVGRLEPEVREPRS